MVEEEQRHGDPAGGSFISDVEFVAEPEIVRDDGGEMGDGDVSATKATEGTAAMGFGLLATNRSLMWFAILPANP